ncbi:MAG: ATP-binding cassette domain-containing protein [Gammaproteobacteria bacterium]|nr:ATP-binding cassette domain-containing protein [Gammaproteobacteria bacterium]MDH5591890.1 ATP-binding cassette domain-containing protein [Gammaproteobacteria bacterium]
MISSYQLNNIKVHRNEQCVLDIPQLTLPAHKCIALLGDNGAGKSTLLDVLAFTSQPSEGEVLLADQKTAFPLSSRQRRTIGYVSQHPFLLSGTVTDNIQLALKLQGIDRQHRPELTQQALNLVNLNHLAKQAANTLSGGELKRAAIARAIAYQPDILLLDEPFSHLDQNHIQQLERIIEKLAQQPGKTVIFSTHNRLQGLALADTTINLVAGKTTSAPLLNLFHGRLHDHIFDTGRLEIHTTSELGNARHIAIDPLEIIISTHELQSSMRNHFMGRLTLIAEEANTVRLTIDCGERFHAIISPESLLSLNLTLGDNIWLSFKSTAVTVF